MEETKEKILLIWSICGYVCKQAQREERSAQVFESRTCVWTRKNWERGSQQLIFFHDMKMWHFLISHSSLPVLYNLLNAKSEYWVDNKHKQIYNKYIIKFIWWVIMKTESYIERGKTTSKGEINLISYKIQIENDRWYIFNTELWLDGSLRDLLALGIVKEICFQNESSYS